MKERGVYFFRLQLAGVFDTVRAALLTSRSVLVGVGLSTDKPKGDITYMRHYEIVVMIHPDQSEQVPNMVNRYKETVTKRNGKIHRFEDWGRRQMAYPIDKLQKAHYVLMNVECCVEALKELAEAFRFNDAVLRNLVLVQKKAMTEPSLIVQRSHESKLAPAGHNRKFTPRKYDGERSPRSDRNDRYERRERSERT